MRKWLKQHLPKRETFKNHRRLQGFGKVLTDPNLWHLNRRSASRGVAVGLFVTFLPIPFQLLMSAGAAIICRANLPLAVILSVINNPFTFVPINYFIYRLGKGILREQSKNGFVDFKWQIDSISHAWSSFLIWLPQFGKAYFLGLGITLIVAPLVGYFLTIFCWHLDVRFRLWQRNKKRDRSE